MEKLSSSVAWSIPGQGQSQVNHFRGNCWPGIVDLACIFWARRREQWHQCLGQIPLLNEWLANESLNNSFHVNGVEYNQAYLLVDGIYPEWAMFISTVQAPQSDKLTHFVKCQEGARKDVERAFGVLQARFEIVKRPARSWFVNNLTNVLMASVILHNMILKDERHENFTPYLNIRPPPLRRGLVPWLQFLKSTKQIHDKETHFKLRNDLVDHLWN